MTTIFTFFLSFFLFGCNFFSGPAINGHWKLNLNLKEDKKLPVIITIGKDEKVTLYNGLEKFELKIEKVKDNHYKIPLHIFDAGLEFSFNYNKDNESNLDAHVLVGHWIKYYKDNYQVPFIGQRIESPYLHPYDLHSKVKSPFATTWELELEDKTKAIGIFSQKGERINGSILTETGDYRYLEGKFSGDQFEVYGFDGIFGVIVEGKIENKKLIGKIWSGKDYLVSFQGKENPKAKLTDPYSFTKLKDQNSVLNFELENTSDEKISLQDAKFQNKVRIILISGTWCPNCLDEAKFMSEWYEQNKQRPVEIFSVFFERAKSPEHAKKLVGHFGQKLNLNYHLLIGSHDSSKKPEDVFPELNKIFSYPTTIFIDKYNKVHKIHSGFSGPGTGIYYEEFKNDFYMMLERLLDS